MNYTKTKFTCKRGSLTIRGVEYRPEGENLPIAIISHGFMANHKTVLQYVKFFAENGYAAYAYDFCGGCAFGGKNYDTLFITTAAGDGQYSGGVFAVQTETTGFPAVKYRE